uniref:Uncharacterized protein n=1 Tax=Candidatus Kentrum sp. FM TaxID=2126340 RepID=A0A450SD97_9GAMM|nr:MAG: hypothetical protein BECKFM1743A_GA0114220_100847 [Candidatus Kentron sp. FM]VFJ51202.1 MAG: hypothetical protein BECKFM1743C_GA0114222_100947 [Candidatus Kentron sp. FM]VFK08859.1 MAG: hypothetical protein BECKFM1743B_GA0114221_100837 [Candidatus Kentron sp. FM]
MDLLLQLLAIGLSSLSVFPITRFSMQMHDCHNPNIIFNLTVQNTVREPICKATFRFRINGHPGIRMLTYSLDCSGHLLGEFQPQTRLALLIRRLAEKNIPNCAGFSSRFKARGRRIASYVTAVQRGSWTIKTSKLLYSLIEIA